MNKKDQKQTVMWLLDNIGKYVLSSIRKDGAIPEAWNEVELRCFVSDKFAQAASVTCIRREPRSKRAREYKKKCQEIF